MQVTLWFGRVCYFFLIYSSIVLIGTAPVVVALQVLALAGVGLAIGAAAIRQRVLFLPPTFVIFLLLFLMFLLVCAVLGMASGQTPAPIMGRFLQNFLLTLTIPIFACGLDRLGLVSCAQSVKHIVISLVVFSLTKIAIFVAVGIAGISPVALDLIFIRLFNTAPTTGGNAGTIFRIMAPADFIAPLVMYYCLVYLRGWWRWITVALIGLSVYSSMSRFIWLEGALMLALSVFALPRGKMLAVLMVSMIAVPVLAVTSVPFIEQRYNDPGSQQSDDLRLQQSEALLQTMDENLLFGHGLGSFAYKMIRTPTAPYSYEVQWLEIFYQMGLIGLLFVLGLMTFSVAPLLRSRWQEAVPLLVLFAFSQLAGFANPALFGRASSVGFAFAYCLGTLIRDRAAQPDGAGDEPQALPMTA